MSGARGRQGRFRHLAILLGSSSLIFALAAAVLGAVLFEVVKVLDLDD